MIIFQGKDAIIYIMNSEGLMNIKCVKSFDISIMNDTVETTGVGDGNYKTYEYDRYSWTCRLGTIPTLDSDVVTGFDMTDAMMRGEKLELIIFYGAGTEKKIFYGQCIIPVSDIVATPNDLVHNELELTGTGEFVFILEENLQSVSLIALDGYDDLQALSKAYITEGANNQIKLLSNDTWDQNIKISVLVPKSAGADSFEYDYLPIAEDGVYITNYTAEVEDDNYKVNLTFNFDKENSSKSIEFKKGCRVEVEDIVMTSLGSSLYEFFITWKNGLPANGWKVKLDDVTQGSAEDQNPFTLTIMSGGTHNVEVTPSCYVDSEGVPFDKDFNTFGCIAAAIVGSLLLPNGTVGVPYNHTRIVTGTAPFSIIPVTKPSWMTIAISGGTLSFTGTPDATYNGKVEFIITNCLSDELTFDQNLTIVAAPSGTPIYSVGVNANIGIVCSATPYTVYVHPIYSSLATGVQVFSDSELTTTLPNVYLNHYPTGVVFKTDAFGYVISETWSC